MEIKFYETTRGDYPVKNFIESLEVKHRKKVLRSFERLENYGLFPLLKTKEAEKIKSNLYELRIKYQGIYYRIFFTIYDSGYWMIHAFKKKSDKIPNREIKKAQAIKDIIIIKK
ncbi:type II toxin-antitoxin system RelE/ParE family toxin [Candidatus Falkowbacteria bacterium]|nr:type II toxin-antitoxin system RelE/ParE family toxin [Candidatus Falkowbacteria bacterium]